MFLRKPLEEFPDLVEKYRNYCEDNDLDYIEASFENFIAFFHSLYITIRVEDHGDRFLSTAINYGTDPDRNNPLRTFAKNRQQAEYDAVFLGFQLLNQLEE